MAGRVEWIGVRAQKRAALTACESVDAIADCGLRGDHSARRRGHRRQVSIVDAATLDVLRGQVATEPTPELLRRNIVVSGLDLRALIGSEFSIGAVRFYATCDCAPCKRMDENLGAGALAAMECLGGICAKVLTDGTIHIGDAVTPVSA